MLSVKVEFCPLDWYSSSPTAIVFYNKIYRCKVFPSNCQKLKKENAIYMQQVLHRLRDIDVVKRLNLLRHEKPILGKIHVI